LRIGGAVLLHYVEKPSIRDWRSQIRNGYFSHTFRMMTFRFEDPWLLLLVLPAGWLWLQAFFRRGHRPALPFPDAHRWQVLETPAGARVRAALPASLLGLAGALLLCALARPQKLAILAPSDQAGTDIMLVIDTSGSMRALDFKPKDRITAAKEAARDFIRNRTNDRIGIVAFAGYALLQCPLTTDYAALSDYIDLVEVGMLRDEGTAIGDAIGTAVNHLLDAPGKSRVIILLSDGRSHGGTVSPLTAAMAAKKAGIRIYTIGTAAVGPAMIPVFDPIRGWTLAQIPEELDEDTMIAIARETGARYFRATNRNELGEIYREIDRMEKTPSATPPRVAARELYGWFLVPAFALLLAEALLSRTVLLTLP